MKQEIEIRQIQEIDLSNGFLEVLSFLTKVELKLEEAREILKTRDKLGYITFVAVKNKSVIGTTSLIIEQKFIHSGGKVGYLEEVVVHPESRGEKVGVRLIDAVIQRAKQEGCYKLLLHCAWRNIEYYEKLGFKYNEASMRMDL